MNASTETGGKLLAFSTAVRAGNPMSTSVQSPEPTHYVWWDQPGGRYVRAICGRLIRRRDHVNEPSCPHCQQILAERDRDNLEAH